MTKRVHVFWLSREGSRRFPAERNQVRNIWKMASEQRTEGFRPRLRQVPPVIAEGFIEPDKVCFVRGRRKEVVPRDYARLLCIEDGLFILVKERK